MGDFVLYGHSFVRRLGNKHGLAVNIELQNSTIPVKCYGEGGLTFARMQNRPAYYFGQLKEAKPAVLILDLGTNDLCLKGMTPTKLCSVYSDWVHELWRWDITPSAVVSLPVLPRSGNLRKGQVSLRDFNDRVDEFNSLLTETTFKEDKWWVWHHRGLRSVKYSLDGVHLNELGTIKYERSLRQLVKFFEYRIWF